jgi:hypothetical protein
MTKQNNIHSYIYSFFTHFIESEISEVKSIDLFFDQFNTQNEGQSDGQNNPRVLIEIVDNDITQGLGGIQYSEAFTVVLHIGIDIVSTFHNKSKILDKNLGYLDLLHTIYDKFNTLTSYQLPDELWNNDFIINNLRRSRLLLATNPEPIKVSQIEFTCTIEDRTKVKTYNTEVLGAINQTITITT